MRRTTIWNLTCECCGKKFTATRHDAKHCTPKCRKASSRKKKKKQEQIQAIHWWVEHHLDIPELEKLQALIEQRIAKG